MSNGGLAPGSSAIIDVVVDASIAVKWFVPERHSTEAIRLLDPGFRRHIPLLFHTEFGQTIWKKVYQRKEIEAGDGRSILRGLTTTALEVHAVAPLVEPAFEIALATGRTVYESFYLALAVALNCKLVTADQKLFDALQATPFVDDVVWIASAF
jgi:predicted nucleic acid-binding protein